MELSGRERFLLALNNVQPDRLPCQVHSFMDYYLKTYMNGCNQYEAYKELEMDPVIYENAIFNFSTIDMDKWRAKTSQYTNSDHNIVFDTTITTPQGTLHTKAEQNQFTYWTTEYIIKNKDDFELWAKYCPIPIKVDWTPVIEAKKRIGNTGIVRSGYFDFGQGSPWQSFCMLYGTESSIMLAMDEPDYLRYCLKIILEKKLKVIELGDEFQIDLVETGGGGGSNTVISPSMHKEFCLPYDIIQHKALKEHGVKVVYHLCGGLMKTLDLVVKNGADVLETMTPKSMGGDCDMVLANKMIGDNLSFIGGFDQSAGFENGTEENIREQINYLFAAKSKGGFICSPSDHFFNGKVENLKLFSKICKEHKYY